MPLLTYEGARPWAKAIKAAVVSRTMPPWFADPHYGEFRNAPTITPAEIGTLTAWADGGAVEGDPADRPPAVRWPEGWRIDPDVLVSMPKPHRVGPKGDGQIKEFFIENPFKEDTWVSAIEIRPSDPSAVHHVIVQINEVLFTGGILGAALGAGPAGSGSYSGTSLFTMERLAGRGTFKTMEAVYAPGSPPLDFRFANAAKLIRGKTPIRLEVHYTPNGRQTQDQTKIAFTLAKGPVERSFVIMAPEHLADIRKPIPPGAENWETKGELVFNRDVQLVWFMPHMHLRGKDMTFRLIYPDGKEETVLSAKFNFHWQLGYELKDPISVPSGTRMVVTAHHDNSANNPSNPEPDKKVRWGEMTADEMMLPWFGVLTEKNLHPMLIATYKPGHFDGPAPKARVVAAGAP
jgi:hypothetical protein